MTDDEQPVRMTTDEIALMRAIIRWRKANEIDFVRRPRVLGTYWIDTFGRTGEPRRAVAFERREVRAIGMAPDRYASYVWVEAESVTQAVDLLVAYGYLPQRFSSAYAEGYLMGGTNRWADENGRLDPAAYDARLPLAKRS